MSLSLAFPAGRLPPGRSSPMGLPQRLTLRTLLPEEPGSPVSCPAVTRGPPQSQRPRFIPQTQQGQIRQME